MVVFDANTLLLFLSPTVPAPRDDETGQPVIQAQDRINYLIKTLENSQTKVIIPTPVVAEIMVRSGTAGSQYLDIINSAAVFRIEPFDQKAAIEVGLISRQALEETGDKRGNAQSDDTWAKIKYDRQIVAIAKTRSIRTIYSDDRGLRACANRQGIVCVRVAELPLSPDAAQVEMLFPTSAKVSDSGEQGE